VINIDAANPVSVMLANRYGRKYPGIGEVSSAAASTTGECQ
jgi:hypothetical protein